VRDAAGNVLGVYNQYDSLTGVNAFTRKLRLEEISLMGKIRIGIDETIKQIASVNFISQGYSGNNEHLNPVYGTPANALTNLNKLNRTLGRKRYEIINNVGHVIAIISDRKEGVDLNNDLISDFYLSELINATDYYAFGSLTPGRIFSGSTYRYGFNGEENNDELGTIDYEYRLYNPALGRWISIEPLARYFPAFSTYSFAANCPILFSDKDGQYAVIDDVIAALVGGIVNTAIHSNNGDIQTVGQGFEYFGAGAAAGWMALYPEFGGWLVGGALLVAVDDDIKQRNHPEIQMTLGDRMTNAVGGAVLSHAGGLMLNKAFSFVAGRFIDKNGQMVLEEIEFGGIQSSILIEGAPVGLYSANNMTKVANHLARFGEHPENTIMLDRMRKIATGEIAATDIDVNFMKHELRELELMESGMIYEEAHKQTLIEQGMYHPCYDQKLYTKEALEAGNKH
jgi:RHS repeat-associated protein